MNGFYYLLPSLSRLDPEKNAPMSREAFFKACAPFLGEKAYAELQNARLDIENINDHELKNPLLKAFVAFEHGFRMALAAFREKTYGLSSPTAFQNRPVHPAGRGLFEKTREAKTPLEAQTLVYKARWRFIDELSDKHFFDFTALTAYALKLSLLLEKDRQDPPTGKQFLEKIHGLTKSS